MKRTRRELVNLMRTLGQKVVDHAESFVSGLTDDELDELVIDLYFDDSPRITVTRTFSINQESQTDIFDPVPAPPYTVGGAIKQLISELDPRARGFISVYTSGRNFELLDTVPYKNNQVSLIPEYNQWMYYPNEYSKYYRYVNPLNNDINFEVRLFTSKPEELEDGESN